jgi:hypothetical protein
MTVTARRLHVRMTGVDDLIGSFTARQHSLIARWQATGGGITKQQFDHRVARGVLVRVFHDVYRLRGAPFTQQTRWLAAVLAGGDGAVLSHQAAAVQHRYEIRRVRPVVTTPHARHPEIDGVTWHRTRRHHDIVVVDKIPTTSRARTMLDLAAVLPYDVYELLLQNAVTGGRVRIEELLAILDRRGGRGVPGMTKMRAALDGALVDEDIQRKLELIIARIIDEAPVPKPERQYPVVGADGKQYRLDNFWPSIGVAVEGDGRRWHGTVEQARKTRERARAITATGIELYTYGWSEATETPLALREEVVAIVLGRLRMPRSG